MAAVELEAGDYVYGWWAVLADDGTSMLVCLMKRRRWNFIFRLDNRDPDHPGVRQWVMQPEPHEPSKVLHRKIEQAFDAIFAGNESRRQVFVEVGSSDINAALDALQTIGTLGFPLRLSEDPAS